MDAIVSAVAALVGVALGGYLHSLSARRMLLAQQRSEFFERERHVVRELFEVLAAHQHSYTLTIANSMAVLRGSRADTFSADAIPWERLRTLIWLYAPELRELEAQLDAHAEPVGIRMIKARTGMSMPEAQKQALIEMLGADVSSLNSVYASMKSLLLRRATELREETRRSAGLPPLPDHATEA